MHGIWRLACIAGVVLGGGCAGELLVYDEAGKPLPGVPVRGMEVYVKTGWHDKHTKGVDCDKARFVETASLPTLKYYVGARSAQLAKTAFHIKFSDNGAVAEVGLDSEPAGADVLRAGNELIKTLAPLLGVQASASAAAGAEKALPRPAEKPACDAGEARVRYIRLDEYIQAQRGASR